VTTPAPFDVDVDALLKLPEAERERELALLGELKELQDRNPLWRYRPHEGERERKLKDGEPLDGNESRGQLEFHEISRDGLYMGAAVAGNKFGKTHAGTVDNLIQVLPAGLVPPWLLPYKRYGLDGDPVYVRSVGVDLPNWLNKVMEPKLRSLIPPEALFKGAFDKAYSERTHKLRFKDGSWWDFLTHDMEVDAFAGADLHRIHFDEEPPGEKGKIQYEESLIRLVLYGGDVRFTLTPLLGLSWLYEELTDGFGNPRDDDECKVVRGSIDDNPHLDPVARDRALRRYAKQPLKMEARRHGRWVHFAGLIYPDFREDGDGAHVVRPRPIPRERSEGEDEEESRKRLPAVPVYQGIDPGINENHPVGLVYAWMAADDVLEVFHAVKRPDWTVADVAAYCGELEEELAFKPRWRVIDPSAQNRHHATGRSVQWEYQQHGIFTIPGQNSREAGYNAVTERLKTRRLLVQASCPELVKEFQEYRWKVSRRQSDDAPKAEPIKRNDDLLDALRYLVMSMPQPNTVRGGDEDYDSPPIRAFKHSLDRLRRGKRPRIGGYIPA
jgi:hypothetical protein